MGATGHEPAVGAAGSRRGQAIEWRDGRSGSRWPAAGRRGSSRPDARELPASPSHRRRTRRLQAPPAAITLRHGLAARRATDGGVALRAVPPTAVGRRQPPPDAGAPVAPTLRSFRRARRTGDARRLKAPPAAITPRHGLAARHAMDGGAALRRPLTASGEVVERELAGASHRGRPHRRDARKAPCALDWPRSATRSCPSFSRQPGATPRPATCVEHRSLARQADGSR